MKKVPWLTVAALAVIAAIVLRIPLKRRAIAQSGFRPVLAYQIWRTVTQTSSVMAVPGPASGFRGQNANGDVIEMLMGGTDKIRHLQFPSRGILVEYYPDNNTKMTIGRGIPQEPHYFGPNCESIPNQTGETKTILGFNTLHVVSGDANRSVDEWIAPALNCESLLRTLTWGNSANTEVATAALATPPDQSLLVVPPNAQEQSPSVFYPGAGHAIPGTPNLNSGYARDAAARSSGSN